MELAKFEDLPGDALLRVKHVLAVYPVSQSHWFEKVKEGIYPAPVKLGQGKIVAWRVSDIRSLLAKAGQSDEVPK